MLALKDSDLYSQRFGFKVMDKLWQTCCGRLQSSLLEHEYLAQPSQNEFVILGKGVVELADVRAQISRFTQALGEKAVIDGYDFYM